MKPFFSVVILWLFFGWARAFAAEPASVGRERLLMDSGWRFHLGNDWGIGQNLAKAGTGFGPASMVFSDASWRQVNLPHDWAVELPFDPKADAGHGFKALGDGFPQNNVGWYRRTLELRKTDTGKRLWLEFDGGYRDCTVFVNGWFVGHHESGYTPFRYDITDVARCGERNVVAVRVDASQAEGWFYEGAGLYRHVWLVKTAPLAIAPDGVFVSSEFAQKLPEGPAQIRLQTRLRNTENSSAEVSVHWEIKAPNGTVVAKAKEAAKVGAKEDDHGVEHTVKLEAPELWSPETPQLYTLTTVVERGGQVIDQIVTEFGVRTLGFDAEKGFLLNGKVYEIKGTCNHQDHAGVGTALPDALQYFRIARLKEMGSNAYRTSHNPPTVELLEACDRLGMLVIDENRLLGSDASNLDRVRTLICRDRNHPSVFMWSIANEEFTVQGTPTANRVASAMRDLIKRLDPTRPLTYAAPVGNEFLGINEMIEVRGWNYHVGQDMDAYHRAHPSQPNVGTEQGSTVSTRGIYANDKERGYVSAYDDNAPSWAHTAEVWWSYFAARPWLSGGFVWTGFDYRGEPTPYAWPCINSHFGILDTCGFPKDNFWYYQAWWTNRPVLHLLPHWNWSSREGQEIDVRALSNCEEVELFLDGSSLGRQTMKRNSELKWKVGYKPGTLSAKGFNGGKVVAETKIETTGSPAAVQLATDRATIRADGEDVSVVTVSVTDAQGRKVPIAADNLSFELKGPGRIIGMGNGDPSSHEPDVMVPTSSSRTQVIADWRWKKVADTEAPNLPEVAASLDDSGWDKTDVNAESGPMQPAEKAVFRAHFSVSAENLSASAVELWFGKIEGSGYVSLNGRKIADNGDSRAASIYDVKALLHPGENTIAVVIANYGATAGINKGVGLRLQDDPQPIAWRRSVFNGLAQVIVQSSKEGGTLSLTARAPGLKPATVSIAANAPTHLRAVVP